MNEIITAIQMVGFPIVICLVLMWFINKNEERHTAELKEITNAVNNNTVMLEKLLTHLEFEEGDKNKHA